MRILGMLPVAGPMRNLIYASLITTIGNGLSAAASTLYAVRVVGVTNHTLGLGFALAAVVALFGGLAVGHAADRLGAREVLLAVIFCQGAITVVFAFTRSVALFLAVIVGLAVTNQASANVRGAIVAQITEPATRVRDRAFLRSMTNLGVGIGSVVAGVAITIDTPRAYSAIILIDALSFFASLIFLAKLPRVPPTSKQDAPRATAALRDKPFVLAALLTGMLCVHYSMLVIAVPLWVVQQTEAPRWIVAGALTLNTAMCVLFQVRASRGADTVQNGAFIVRKSSIFLAAACGIYWLAHGRQPWLGGVLILLGALVHVVGELYQASGTWAIGYGAAPATAMAQYQSVWQSAFTIGNLIGPPLIAGFVVTNGLVGWGVLAGIYVLAGSLMVPVTNTIVSRLPRDVGI